MRWHIATLLVVLLGALSFSAGVELPEDPQFRRCTGRNDEIVDYTHPECGKYWMCGNVSCLPMFG